jgi:hypothetical protein
VKTLGLTWAGSDAVAKAGKLESAMPKQPHLDTIVAGDHISQDQLHDSGYSSVDRRIFLTGAAAATTELMSMPASALEPPTADLAAALARFRSSVPPNFNRDYVEHVVIPFFLTSLYEGERPVMPMINVNFSKSRNCNSGFGTVFGVVDGKPQPVCDYAGFAPFGFGYRRCPGEQLTILVFEDFLRKVWRDKIVFRKLNLANPGRGPIGPNTVIEDDIGFARPA